MKRKTLKKTKCWRYSLAKSHMTTYGKITEKQNKALENYTNRHGPGFLDKSKSCEMAGYKEPRAAAHAIFVKNPITTMVLKEMLSEPMVDEKIMERFQKILNKGGRDFLPVCREIFKLRGDYAPEKQVVMNMTPDELRSEKDEVISLLKASGKKLNGRAEEIGPPPEGEGRSDRSSSGSGEEDGGDGDPVEGDDRLSPEGTTREDGGGDSGVNGQSPLESPETEIQDSEDEMENL